VRYSGSLCFLWVTYPENLLAVFAPYIVYNLITITGYLCGKCRYNKGVSGLLNKCVDCGYENTMLVVALGT